MNPAFEATATFAAPLEYGRGDARPPRLVQALWRLLRPQRPIAAECTDRSTGLYNRAGLFAAAHEQLRDRAREAPASMVVLEFADLREVYDIYGAPIARKVVARIVRRLRAAAGARGLVGRTGPAQFAVVLPGATQEKALRRLQRGFGTPARIEFDAGDSEIVLVPDVLVDTAEAGTQAMQGLYRDMCRELSRFQKDERRRLSYLASERERHSRPMSIPASG